MAITNKALHKQLCALSDIFSQRMAKSSWLNYDCSWVKRTDEPDLEDVLVIVVRGPAIKKAEKALDYICDITDDIPLPHNKHSV